MAPKKREPKPETGALCDLTEKRGIKMWYDQQGPNKPEWQGDKEQTLFLLLGSTADLRKTTDQQYINQSVSYFKVVSYDHRNTGRTTIKDEPCTMEDYADDAAALIEAVVPAEKLPVCVMGVSFGGMVAQHLAIRHPKLIKKLVLCCCATGGEGGMSFPIHEWYKEGMTIEDRVVKKIFQANTDRDEKWKETATTEWAMVNTLLVRDEKVGLDEPLRMEGAMRQLEARKNHNTWDKIGDLEMPVLCCGSHKDNITPPELMRNLVKKIKNCESKLDFDWGHPFIAADVKAMPFVNEWLRAAGGGAGQMWTVVGGADKGGILVRKGEDTASEQEKDRLSTGAKVKQLQLVGERLNYEVVEGTGPKTGWVSLKVPGKDLLVKS